MNIRNVRKRKAISPVLATVILIAITLVAGVAIAGFAFGLFGTLGTTANISVQSAACYSARNTGDVIVANSGGATATITGANPAGITVVAVKIGGTNSTSAPFNVPANTATADVHIKGTFAAGQSITGSLVVNGGVAVPFTATCT
jgi:flagellin-like protein